jgi:hypothetical protein
MTRMVAAGLVLTVVLAGCSSPRRTVPPPSSSGASTSVPTATASSTLGAGLADVLRNGPVFGVHLLNVDQASVDRVTATTGCRPSWVEIFISVSGGTTVQRLNAIPGVPLLSLEPWDGKVDDPNWTLATTISGKHDRQYRMLAATIREYGRPLLLRFAHEMNGRWYPWGPVGGNTPAQYVQAWRHVVRLFDQVGATNALWIWSPNILQGAVRTPIRAFYPGDDVVDFVGMTGYGEFDRSPDLTYKATIDQMAKVTSKPVILTEIGVRPSSQKTSWLKAFGGWLAAHRQVVGFIWSLPPPGQGARYDWRYDDSSANLTAFKTSLRQGHVAC